MSRGWNNTELDLVFIIQNFYNQLGFASYSNGKYCIWKLILLNSSVNCKALDLKEWQNLYWKAEIRRGTSAYAQTKNRIK